MQRWKQRPEGANWGDFGDEDQRGRLNLVTAEKVLQGVAEVRSGQTFCLSLPLDYPGGNLLNERRHPPVLRPTIRKGRPNMNYGMFRDNPAHTDVISDDLAILHLQYSTQWDSLAHVGQRFDADGDGLPESVYYNGYRADEYMRAPEVLEDAGVEGAGPFPSTSGARALGIENMATHGIQGRAVLIDLHAHFGNERAWVGYEQLMRVMEIEQVVVEKGDLVCLHTGFAQAVLDMQLKPDPHVLENSCAVLDGRDPRLLQWITDSGLAALIADNYAVEGHPATSHVGCCSTLPLHEHCLFKLGIPLGELWHLTPLAQQLRMEKRNRFLLTAPPLRLPGAVGSPVTPIATL
ncbi:MAG: cyclase family protein [Polaromonas sp.]|nr:cyclase family protein [Polaromonas sp.]